MNWRKLLFWRKDQPAGMPPESAHVISSNAPIHSSKQAIERKFAGLTAAKSDGTGGNAVWTGADPFDFNPGYLNDLNSVVRKCTDLYANNPRVRGFMFRRVAMLVGAGLKFSCSIRGAEVGMPQSEAAALGKRMDRYFELHSKNGHYDASGKNRSQGLMRFIAILTAFVQGTSLIHRVWSTHPDCLLPVSWEVIPGSRIETPQNKLGDPTILKGFQYADARRSKLVGIHVRKAALGMGGDVAVSMPEYDFLPIEDVALYQLPEIAGLDRSLPLAVAIATRLRHMNLFTEAILKAARAQVKYPVAITTAQGANKYDEAENDASEAQPRSSENVGFVETDTLAMIYLAATEKLENISVKLPEPNVKEFCGLQDEHCSSGLSSPISLFTCVVDSSYSAGRQEQQQDMPLVTVYREAIYAGDAKLHQWNVDGVVLSGLEILPNYATARGFFTQWHVTPPGQLSINPVDTENADAKAMENGSKTHIGVSEEKGGNFEHNQYQEAEAFQIAARIEVEMKLPTGWLTNRLIPNANYAPVAAPPNEAPKPPRSPIANRSSRISGRYAAVERGAA